MINIQNLIDDARCFEAVRQLRWPEGVHCPACGAADIAKRGFHTQQTARQRYECRACGWQFDDLTDTIFEGHRQPLKVWVVCLYWMGLNLSNQQIAAELDLSESGALAMTTPPREGMVAKKKPATLRGVVACDEVYVVAGYKGHPDIMKPRLSHG